MEGFKAKYEGSNSTEAFWKSFKRIQCNSEHLVPVVINPPNSHFKRANEMSYPSWLGRASLREQGQVTLQCHGGWKFSHETFVRNYLNLLCDG